MADRQEMLARRERVEQAEQNGRMEGLAPSREARLAAEVYVSGELDSRTLVEKIRGWYGHE